MPPARSPAARSPDARSPDTTPKPGQRVLAALRRMIADGAIADGERIAEIPTAERLGVSRMPVRTALRALALEGLVVPLGKRGYAACRPQPGLAAGAIQVRGVLEGLAARLAAMAPDHAETGARLAAIIAPCAGLLAADTLETGTLSAYFTANAAFHAALVAASANPAIAQALAHNNRLPLAGASAFAFDTQDHARSLALLRRAHEEHRQVAELVGAGAGAAAEAAMRAHAETPLAL